MGEDGRLSEEEWSADQGKEFFIDGSAFVAAGGQKAAPAPGIESGQGYDADAR